MDSHDLLNRLGGIRNLTERDLAVGDWPRARKRATLAIAHLLQVLQRGDPEIVAWLRILATLARADTPPGRGGQLSLWPALECNAEDSPDTPGGATLRRPASVGFITQDARLIRAFAAIEKLAPTDLPILVEGETGTGKEIVARAIHGLSSRAKGEWVAVNCGAIPVQLQESELFGHARGAFTGATVEKPGLFEAAHQGTLFLDEVGEMQAQAQVKLLRVLETGELRRLGEVRTRHVSVRIVAATNCDVDEATRAGRFRRDLLFRLSAVRIKLSPLRERRGDILPLAHHFLRKAAPCPPTLTPAARTALLANDWPGNARELKFAIERAVALSNGGREASISAEMLCRPEGPVPQAGDSRTSPGDLPAPAGPLSLPSGESLDAFLGGIERRLIREALSQTGGNRTLAARLLGGLSRTTLIGKMKRLGLFRPASEAYS